MDVFLGVRGLFLLSGILWLLLTLREAFILTLEAYTNKKKLPFYAIMTLSFVFMYLMVSFTNWFDLLVPVMGVLLVLIIVFVVKYAQDLREIERTRLTNALKTVDATRSFTLVEVLINSPKLWAKFIKKYGTKKTALVNAVVSGLLGFVLFTVFLMVSQWALLTWIVYLGVLVFGVILGGFVYYTSRKLFTKTYQTVTEE